MWSGNSTTYGFCSNSHCMCHTSMVPCLGTSPMTQYWYSNVQLSSPTFPKYQSTPDNTIYVCHENGHNQLEFSPFNPGNLVQETVGSHSSSTRTSSPGTQLVSKDDSKGPLSRQDRILRYFEKKKSRKYEKKIIYSSRKTYARTRPRIRGRFARSSQN
ncbi:zinc finger protein CONSTANS-LIKE 5-like [Bidens hawaiensis]|uniref:zinc finger protein CONSTANS-LIKE 5-like n=1 Tax=Bidens hawaiensis TaxID=980011 RepID=UPI004049BE7F